MEVKKPRLRKQTALILAAILLAFSLFSAFLYFNTTPDSNLTSSRSKSTSSTAKTTTKTTAAANTKTTTKTTDVANTKATDGANTKAATNTFTFTAQPGDSYTLFARQAIASYLEQNQISATDQQKLIAEINLINHAGAPYLEIGDQISIQSSDIAQQFLDTTTSTTTPTNPTISTTTTAPAPTTPATKTTTFTAQSGDSYITLARQAIKQSKSGAKLSPAQKVAAETKLAANANWPAINLGQTVQIAASDLEQSINFANNLSPAELSAWQPFADLIAW